MMNDKKKDSKMNVMTIIKRFFQKRKNAPARNGDVETEKDRSHILPLKLLFSEKGQTPFVGAIVVPWNIWGIEITPGQHEAIEQLRFFSVYERLETRDFQTAEVIRATLEACAIAATVDPYDERTRHRQMRCACSAVGVFSFSSERDLVQKTIDGWIREERRMLCEDKVDKKTVELFFEIYFNNLRKRATDMYEHRKKMEKMLNGIKDGLEKIYKKYLYEE